MTSIGQKNVTQQMSSWKSPYRLISACKPRSASNSSTSRYESEKRKYQPTARRITSGSNWRHLNRQETDDAKSIGPPYQTTPAKLQHCPIMRIEASPRCKSFEKPIKSSTVEMDTSLVSLSGSLCRSGLVSLPAKRLTRLRGFGAQKIIFAT